MDVGGEGGVGQESGVVGGVAQTMETYTKYGAQHQEHGEIDDGVVNVVMRSGMMKMKWRW